MNYFVVGDKGDGIELLGDRPMWVRLSFLADGVRGPDKWPKEEVSNLLEQNERRLKLKDLDFSKLQGDVGRLIDYAVAAARLGLFLRAKDALLKAIKAGAQDDVLKVVREAIGYLRTLYLYEVAGLLGLVSVDMKAIVVKDLDWRVSEMVMDALARGDWGLAMEFLKEAMGNKTGFLGYLVAMQMGDYVAAAGAIRPQGKIMTWQWLRVLNQACLRQGYVPDRLVQRGLKKYDKIVKILG